MKRKFKKVFSLLLALMMMATLGVTFLASATGDTSNQADVAVSAMKEGLAEVTGTLTIGNILTVILAVIGICIGLVFFWWAIRKVIRMVMAAFKKGKISV